MSTGPSVSSISSKAALEQRRSSDAAFGSPRGGPVPACHGQVLSVNLEGVWNCSQIFGRGMVARGHGSIIYIVVVLVGGIPYAIIGAGKPNAEPLLRNLGALLVLVVYFAVFGWVASFWDGPTIGGRVLGIRIVRRDGGSIREWQAAVRRSGCSSRPPSGSSACSRSSSVARNGPRRTP